MMKHLLEHEEFLNEARIVSIIKALENYYGFSDDVDVDRKGNLILIRGLRKDILGTDEEGTVEVSWNYKTGNAEMGFFKDIHFKKFASVQQYNGTDTKDPMEFVKIIEDPEKWE